MEYLSLAKAAKLPNAPTRQALNKMGVSGEYRFITKHGGKWAVIDGAEWWEYLKRRTTVADVNSFADRRDEALGQKARLARLKADEQEMKNGLMSNKFVDKAEAEYWLSIIQKGISEMFTTQRRNMPRILEAAKVGDKKKLEAFYIDDLKAVFDRAQNELINAVADNN
jgi:phage terminase Nu1 subunit (DNA packaging protein)